MKILHTSDWHLGQNFMGKSREDEHREFLVWLHKKVIEEDINVLIVAGDIFDINTPPNYALSLYYNFLKNLLRTNCKYIIITAGNHDSVSTLKAPKELLSLLNIHVIASGEENEIIEINLDGDLKGVVCAVPFLRDRVVRKLKIGERAKDKEISLTDGIKEYYNKSYNKAKDIIGDRDIPIIATGHLTTVGAKLSDSEREIYIGGKLHIDNEFLGEKFDYVALGHLHNNQAVGKNHIRYSGSPIPLSFSEAKSKKKVNIITFKRNIVIVKEIIIPISRKLKVIKGNLNSVISELEKIEDKSSWIEIKLDDENPSYSNSRIRDKAKELGLSILAIKIDKSSNALHSKKEAISLNELQPIDVFKRLLDVDEINDDKLRDELIKSFKIIVNEVEIA